METVYDNKNTCTGCSACFAVCPFGAIQMAGDQKGFSYPVIQQKNCRNCGKCKTVCQACQGEIAYDKDKQSYFVAVHKDKEVLLHSQSGGMFPVISDIIFEKGGTVYGCIYDPRQHKAIHTRAATKEERDKMRGSKYIQSDLESSFILVQNDLLNGNYVCFSGTPCQNDGLRRFLKAAKTPDERLYTVDIICHGVPSPLLWKEHIKYLERKYKGKVEKVRFRDKSFGWISHKETVYIHGRRYSGEKFKHLFYSNTCLRPSCYQCAYAKLARCTDFTIGDAWKRVRGTENGSQEGQSLLIINSEKGRQLLPEIAKNSYIEAVNIDPFMQPNLHKPSSSNDDPEEFWISYQRLGYSYLLFVFGKQGLINKSYKIIRRILLKLWRRRSL